MNAVVLGLVLWGFLGLLYVTLRGSQVMRAARDQEEEALADETVAWLRSMKITPTGTRRCRGTTKAAGEPQCKRGAQAGKAFCAQHEPKVAHYSADV